MNRRDVFKSFAAFIATTFGWSKLPAVPSYEINVKDPVPEAFCTRTKRYRKYRKMLDGDSHLRETFNSTYNEVCKNITKKIKEEFEQYKWMKFNKIHTIVHHAMLYGDAFVELVGETIERPIIFQILTPDTVFRIETIKGKLLEFQQSEDGPDYQALQVPITQATDEKFTQTTVIRFMPEQIVHLRIGSSRKDLYPYGVSLLEDQFPFFGNFEEDIYQGIRSIYLKILGSKI